MAMRIRSMSAGRSGASVYNANVNGDQGGGNKLQGLASTTNKRVNFIMPAIKRRAYATKEQRAKVFCINQLGGIGRPSKMFATGADGVNKLACLKDSFIGVLNAIYQLVLKRNADSSGIKTYGPQLSGRNLSAGVSTFVSQLINAGAPTKEAYIYMVLIQISQSPEADSVASPSSEEINKFYQKYMPVALSLGLVYTD